VVQSIDQHHLEFKLPEFQKGHRGHGAEVQWIATVREQLNVLEAVLGDAETER
jgi:hypothetical protein